MTPHKVLYGPTVTGCQPDFKNIGPCGGRGNHFLRSYVVFVGKNLKDCKFDRFVALTWTYQNFDRTVTRHDGKGEFMGFGYNITASDIIKRRAVTDLKASTNKYNIRHLKGAKNDYVLMTDGPGLGDRKSIGGWSGPNIPSDYPIEFFANFSFKVKSKSSGYLRSEIDFDHHMSIKSIDEKNPVNQFKNIRKWP